MHLAIGPYYRIQSFRSGDECWCQNNFQLYLKNQASASTQESRSLASRSQTFPISYFTYTADLFTNSCLPVPPLLWTQASDFGPPVTPVSLLRPSTTSWCTLDPALICHQTGFNLLPFLVSVHGITCKFDCYTVNCVSTELIITVQNTPHLKTLTVINSIIL